MDQMRDLEMLALTIWLEARGEPYAGKLGVAWVICNRAGKEVERIAEVVLKPFQFSCWNTECKARTMIHGIDRDSSVWFECCKAAAAAYFELTPDPTKGANHYLNPTALEKLPSWYSPDKVTVSLGAHVFLKL